MNNGVESLERRRLLASPELDLSFGEGGIALVPEFAEHLFLVHELADGRIVAAGEGSGPYSGHLGSDDPLVARFNADGTPDTSFGSGGALFLPQGGTVVGTADAALAPDGKIVVLHAITEGHEIRIFRFNADGTIDTSFGTNGMAAHAVANFSSTYARTIAVQPDGKIVFSFTGENDNGIQDYLGRLNADGSADSSFRGGLTALVPTGILIEDLLVAPDGRIYVAGQVGRSNPGYVAGVVARFHADGTPDTSYGVGGFADMVNTAGAPVVDGNLDAPTARSSVIALDRQGRVLANTHYEESRRDSIRLMRFTLSGKSDKTFGGGNGFVDLGPFEAVPTPLVVDANDRITGGINGGGLAALFRLNGDGSADNRFGQAGLLLVNRKTIDTNALTLDSHGNILVAGQQVEPYFSAVARFVADSKDVVLNGFGHLLIGGSDDADVITVDRVGAGGDQIVVHRNAVDFSFALADVKQVIVYPSAGGDMISMTAGIACSIAGGSGNDTIVVGDGGDVTIDGGTGNDRVVCGNNGNRTINLGKGNDRASTGTGRDTIAGEGGDDAIFTGAGNDIVNGGAGDDSILCGGGNDQIYSDEGNDTVHAGAGNDRVQDFLDPPDSEEEIVSSVGRASGNKVYFGEEGNDYITGSKGNDLIFGNGGRDTIYGGRGSDSIAGGGADDLVDARDWRDASNGSADLTTDTVNGGEGDDTIDGSNGPNTLSGDGGDDSINGNGSNDVISGGDGRDRIEAGAGSDSIWGNGGNDSLYGGEGNDRIAGNGGNDSLYGGEGNDRIARNGGRDRLFGGNGKDRIFGGESGDWLYGGTGNDQLNGEGGNDRIYGDDSGTDTLHGGAGDDLLVSSDSSIDQLFGDGGRDTGIADKDDVLEGVESIG